MFVQEISEDHMSYNICVPILEDWLRAKRTVPMASCQKNRPRGMPVACPCLHNDAERTRTANFGLWNLCLSCGYSIFVLSVLSVLSALSVPDKVPQLSVMTVAIFASEDISLLIYRSTWKNFDNSIIFFSSYNQSSIYIFVHIL